MTKRSRRGSGAAKRRPGSRARSGNSSAVAPVGKGEASAPPDPEPWKAHGLTPGQYHFALAWLANGYNATQAYLEAHPGCTANTARVEGSHTLMNPDVRAFLGERLTAYWSRLHMTAEEAIALESAAGRFDVRRLFNERDELLPASEWPDEVVGLVKGMQDGPYGRKLTLVDPHAARLTILEVTGKVKGLGGSVDALAEAIRADRKKHGFEEEGSDGG